MDAVVAGVDGDGAAFDVDEAFVFVLLVARVDGVIPGREIQDTVVDADTVLAGDGFLPGIHGDGAAGHFEVVLRDDAVAVLTGDGQFATAVEGEGRFGPDGAVDVVAGLGIRRGESGTRGDLVGGAVFQGDEHFVARLHIDGSAVVVGDGHVVEDQLDFVLIADVHDHLAVVRAGQDVGASLRDGHAGRGLFREVDGGGLIVRGVEVPVREHVGVRCLRSAFLRHFRLDRLSALGVRSRGLRVAGGEDQDHGQHHQNGDEFRFEWFHQSVSPSSAPRTIMLISRLPLRTLRSSIRAFSVPASFSRTE